MLLIVLDQVGTHWCRDFCSHLHTDLLQIFQALCLPLGNLALSSLQKIWFRSGNWLCHSRTLRCFLLALPVCSSRWKTDTTAHLQCSYWGKGVCLSKNAWPCPSLFWMVQFLCPLCRKAHPKVWYFHPWWLGLLDWVPRIVLIFFKIGWSPKGINSHLDFLPLSRKLDHQLLPSNVALCLSSCSPSQPCATILSLIWLLSMLIVEGFWVWLGVWTGVF